MVLVLALSSISLSPARAEAPCYSVVEGVLTDGSDCAGVVSIDTSVTSIGNNAFRDNEDLTSITIPSSVTSIGNDAFRNSLITSIIIPSSVTSVGSSAFRDSSLTTVTIPGSVTTIESSVFQDTAALMSVTIGEGVTEIGSSAFYNSSLTALIIPNSVTNIGAYAFAVNRALTSITIGSGVATIGGQAFQDNSALTSISFLGNEPIVGDNVFFSTPSGLISYVPSTADGFVVSDDGLWNGFSISRVVAPSITLTPSTEERSVNTSISGYTITSIGDTITSFSISPAAPAGLTFSTVTGLLTGAPTSVSPATIYTISARNVGGVSTATFTLTVRAVAPVSDNSAANAAAAAAAERAAAAKREAREGILSRLKDGQGLTFESFVKAQISGITPENFAEVQAELLNLSETSRSDINQILKVAYKYEVVGKIGSDRVSYLPPNAFVEIGLIPLMSKNKVALVAAVKRLPLEERKKFADIKAEIDKQMVKIQARKDRLASVIDRIAKRSAA